MAPQGRDSTAFTVGQWTREGFIARIDTHYYIKDRATGQIVRWGPRLAKRKAQKRHLKNLLTSLSKPGPRRHIVGKPRRLGLSTASILTLTDMALHTGWDVGIIAHDGHTTKELMGIGRLAIERLPPDQRPAIRGNSAKALTFGTRTRAEREGGDLGPMNQLIATTAGAKEPLSGAPNVRGFLFSELAKWPGDERRQNDTFRSLIDALPQEGPSICVIESTARGRKGLFFNLFTEAMTTQLKGRQHPWEASFYGWFEDEGSYRPLSKDDRTHWSDWPREDHEEEAELVRLYALTQEQLNFRRWKIGEHNGDVDAFRQEFPSDWRTMFLQDGRAAIPEVLLREQRRNIRPPLRVGNVRSYSASHQPLLVIPGGDWRVWEDPIPGADYVTGGDASEARTETSDHTCFQVFRREVDGVYQVAEWYGRLGQGLAGEVLCDLGLHYNNSLINVERNISSLILHVLKERGYPEDRLFIPTHRQHVDEAQEVNYFTPKTRWNSAHLVQLALYYLQGKHCRTVLRSDLLIDELATLAKDSGGDTDTGGKDRAVAFMMALVAESTWPRRLPEVVSEVLDRWCPTCQRFVALLRCERCEHPTVHQSALNLGVDWALRDQAEAPLVTGVPGWEPQSW